MKHRLAYDLLPDPPHIPPRLLAMRFEAKLSPPEGPLGCRVWVGATCPRGDNGAQVGKMRIKSPAGSMLVTATRVAWFLAGHPWPSDDIYLRRTCGQALCCLAEHLEPQAKVDRRKLSVAQVLECRELYWGQSRRHVNLRATSPLEMASRTLGLTRSTVQRVVEGKRVTPTSWSQWDLTLDDVRQAIVDAERVIEEIRRDKETVWTHAKLASRYSTDLTTVRKLLDGFIYKDAPGPTSALEAREQQEAKARAEARRARQQRQGDPVALTRLEHAASRAC